MSGVRMLHFFESLMEIHSNPQILYYGFKQVQFHIFMKTAFLTFIFWLLPWQCSFYITCLLTMDVKIVSLKSWINLYLTTFTQVDVLDLSLIHYYLLIFYSHPITLFEFLSLIFHPFVYLLLPSFLHLFPLFLTIYSFQCFFLTLLHLLVFLLFPPKFCDSLFLSYPLSFVYFFFLPHHFNSCLNSYSIQFFSSETLWFFVSVLPTFLCLFLSCTSQF